LPVFANAAALLPHFNYYESPFAFGGSGPAKSDET
jgi:hypothetical protein